MRRAPAALVAALMVSGLVGVVAPASAAAGPLGDEAVGEAAAPAYDRGPAGRGGAATNYATLAARLGGDLRSATYATRLAATSSALKAGGLPVTDGSAIVAQATAPVGKLTVLVTERASMALNSDEGGMTVAQLASALKRTGVMTRSGPPATVLGQALREWIEAARADRLDARSLAPLLIREGVLRRTGEDLGKAGADMTAVSFSSLEVMLFAAAFDRSVPAASRKAATAKAGRSGDAIGRGDPTDPNLQACGDLIRNWIKRVSLGAEQVLMSVAGKYSGDAFGKVMARIDGELGALAMTPNQRAAYLAQRPAYVEKVADALGKGLAVIGAIVKIQKAALLYDGVEMYADTPLGDTITANIETPGRDNSSYAPFSAVVGLKPAAAADFEKASTGLSRQLFELRRLIMDCADVVGVQVPSLTMDAGEDLENFRIVWELQTNKWVQWDVGHSFVSIRYPPKTTWFTRPPHAVGSLTKIGNGQAAHVMYARIPAQPDYRIRRSLYEPRTTQAVATASLDFSQPPNLKTLGDVVLSGGNPFALIGTLTDVSIGMFQSMVMPTDSAAITVTYYAPKCTGAAGRAWRAVASEVCDAVTLSIGVTGGGVVTSTPAGANCDRVCDEIFSKGEVVTLAATPAEGYRFDSWQGPDVAGCFAGIPTCTVTMDDSATVEAVFTEIPKTRLRVTVAGSGSVASTGYHVQCNAAASPCDTTTPEIGETVTLTATAAEGHQFDGWSGGGCSGTSTCTVTIAADLIEVTATFSAIPSIFTRVSVGADGEQGLGNSSCPVLSADGTKIAFRSTSSTWVDGDDNRATDVYVKNLVTGAVTRASVGPGGQERTGTTSEGDLGEVGCPAISPDGSRVAFTAWKAGWAATGVMETVTWVKHLGTGSLTWLNHPKSNLRPDLDGIWAPTTTSPVFGDDSTSIYYQAGGYTCLSDQITLGLLVAYYCNQVAVKDLVTGTVSIIDTSRPSNPDGLSRITGVAGGGRFLLIDSDSCGDGWCWIWNDRQVIDTETGALVHLGSGDLIESRVRSTTYGNMVGYLYQVDSDLEYRTRNLASGATQTWTTFDYVAYDYLPLGDGSSVVIATDASVFDPRATGEAYALLDLSSGTITKLLDRPSSDTGLTVIDVTADGESLVIESGSADLVPGDTNGKSDIFLVGIDDLLAAT